MIDWPAVEMRRVIAADAGDQSVYDEGVHRSSDPRVSNPPDFDGQDIRGLAKHIAGAEPDQSQAHLVQDELSRHITAEMDAQQAAARFRDALGEFCDALGIPHCPPEKVASARNAWLRLDGCSRDE